MELSKHLRVLSDAGLVEVHPVAQQRFYSLRPQAFQELSSWVESYRRIWEERMDRFEDGLRVITALLRGPEPVTFEGQFFSVRDAVLRPRPAQAHR